MSDAIAHRGPDDEGHVLIDQATSTFSQYAGVASPPDVRARLPLLERGQPGGRANIGMSHRRFSIIDLSSAGHQPFFDEEQTCCAVFNGEIYNYVEIREDLAKQGVAFRTRSDTEVLVAAYRHWGTECFARFIGFWAVAIYDFRKRKLFLSRDHIGKKPLYWTRTPARLYFASEIKALFQIPEVYARREVDAEAISDWLVYGVRDLDFKTCFAGIRSLPSGSWAEVDASFPEACRRFWHVPETRLSERDISIEEACRELRSRCEEAVRIRLRSDVPLSVELSGGLDSSVVLALAARSYPGRITSYTVRFPEKAHNEEPYARLVAERYGVDYRVVDDPAADCWRDILPFTRLQEEPYHSPNLQTSQVIWSQMRAAGTKVLLSGSAGDENFGGYAIYFARFQRDNVLRGRLSRYVLNALMDSQSTSRLRSLWNPVRAASRAALRKGLPDGVVRRLREDGKAGYPEYFTGRVYTKDLYGTTAEDALLANMTNALMPYWLRSGDKSVMSMPIEPRCPLLDVRVIDLAFRLPVSYLIRHGWRKWILRKAMEDLLPKTVVWRRTKMGFPFPYERFVSESAPVIDVIFARAHNPFVDLSRRAALERSWKAMSFVLWYELYFNENVGLFEDIQETARRKDGPARDYGYTPEYLRSRPAGIRAG